jgi:NADH-quinone oxidoreductase subunit A
MASPLAIAAYLALFSLVGFVFLLVNLVVGWFLRPSNPNEEKLEIYECGEPAIGSSSVQFDLRFYVVALLFLIFDVEIAFFFPWATVFGKANHLANPDLHNQAVVSSVEGNKAIAGLYRELGVDASDPIITASAAEIQASSQQLALASLADIGVFFAVLLVGFAYVWRRGDLDWVRSVTAQRDKTMPVRGPPTASEQETA